VVDTLPRLDHDRILRGLLQVVDATLRTYPAEIAYGLVWTCLGTPFLPRPKLPAYIDESWHLGNGDFSDSTAGGNHGTNQGTSAVAGKIAGASVYRPRVIGDRQVRIDVLETDDGDSMVIFQNLEDCPVSTAAYLNTQGMTSMVEQFSNEELSLSPTGDGLMTSLKLEPREVQVYRA
jgi:hypothetical protein